MGRAVRFSKSVITSTRILSSGEKVSFSSSHSCNGELSQHYGAYYKVGFELPIARPRFSVLGHEGLARVFLDSRVNRVFARFCSSGTELSESEWPETDDEQVGQEVSGTEEDTDENEAYATEDDTDAEAGHCRERNKESRGGDRLFGRDGRAEKLHSRETRPDKLQGKGDLFGGREGGSDSRYIRDSDSDYVEVESDLEGELQEEIERQMAAEPKVRRPSITWGILLTSDLRRKARETVIQYLDAEGISTSELTHIELPTTVEVMQTRLGFLRKLGLDNDSINNYPLVLGCSVQKNMVPVLKYLKKLGMTQHYLTTFLRKYPMILHTSVVIDILPVIYFLRGLDIDPLDIPHVLTRYPDVLGFKTDGTMSTSVAYLVSMGVTTRHVGRMLTEYPEILGMRVASVLKPKVEYLIGLGIPQLIVAKILERRPYILGYDLEQRMQFNVSQLLDAGVRAEAIPGMVAQFPDLLGRVFTSTLESQVKWFKENLELDSDGVARMFEKMPQTIFMHRDVAMERIRFLKSESFTAKEIGLMVTKCPQILVSSISETLRPNITFLTREVKRQRQEVVDFSTYLTYSLESRIKPRWKALGDRVEECSLQWILNCSDEEFQKRVRAGFVGDKVAEHPFVMGGLLPGRLAEDEDEWQPVQQPREQCRFAVL